jgi:hypothetical protein
VIVPVELPWQDAPEGLDVVKSAAVANRTELHMGHEGRSRSVPRTVLFCPFYGVTPCWHVISTPVPKKQDLSGVGTAGRWVAARGAATEMRILTRRHYTRNFLTTPQPVEAAIARPLPVATGSIASPTKLGRLAQGKHADDIDGSRARLSDAT